jgi:hypothetical protein
LINQINQASSQIALIVIKVEDLLPLIEKFIVKELDGIVDSFTWWILVIIYRASLELRGILKSFIDSFAIHVLIQLVYVHV